MTRLRALALILVFVALTACEGERKAIEQDLPATRTTKARADAQQIARAVQLYQATFGTLPPSLDALTRTETVGGVSGGPFLTPIPAPPAGWTPYRYAKQDESRFTVTTSAGSLTVTAP
jgi:hypothetical protein